MKDSAGRPIVVVTGMGIVTSLGTGKDDNWSQLTTGVSGIRTITPVPDRRPADPLRRNGRFRAAERLVDARPVRTSGADGRRGSDRRSRHRQRAAISPARCSSPCRRSRLEWPQRLAVAQAGAEHDETLTYRHALRAARGPGASRPYHERFMFMSVADHLADRFGTKGSPISLSTACASGATAIQLGVEAIRRGETDAALCIGTDGSVNAEALIRFQLLSALSMSTEPPEQASKPFSKNRDGFVMAEGGAALVLESLESAQARGARILGVLEGCGEMTDAFHRTRSSPDGKPIVGCIKSAHHRCRPVTRTTSTTSTPTAPRRRRTTRWNAWASPPCSASARRRFRSRRTSR